MSLSFVLNASDHTSTSRLSGSQPPPHNPYSSLPLMDSGRLSSYSHSSPAGASALHSVSSSASTRDGDMTYPHGTFSPSFVPPSAPSGGNGFYRTSPYQDATSLNPSYQPVDQPENRSETRRWTSASYSQLPQQFSQQHQQTQQGWIAPPPRSPENVQQRRESGRMQDYEGTPRATEDHQSSYEFTSSFSSGGNSPHAFEHQSQYQPSLSPTSSTASTFPPLGPTSQRPLYHSPDSSRPQPSLPSRQSRSSSTSSLSYRHPAPATYSPHSPTSTLSSSAASFDRPAVHQHRQQSYLSPQMSGVNSSSSYGSSLLEQPRGQETRNSSGLEAYQWQDHQPRQEEGARVGHDHDRHSLDERNEHDERQELAPYSSTISPPLFAAARATSTLVLASQRLKATKKQSRLPKKKGNSSSRPISPITGLPTKTLAKRLFPPRDAAKRRYHCAEPGCNRAFGRPSALDTHARHHSGARPFECPVGTCARPFSVFSNLKRHMIVHSGVDFRGVTVHDLDYLRFDASRDPPLFWIDRDTPVMHSPTSRDAIPARRTLRGRRPRRRQSFSSEEEEAEFSPEEDEEQNEEDNNYDDDY